MRKLKVLQALLAIPSRIMVRFPHAKINLGLNVIQRRADGYHDIETVMLPIPLYDILEVIVDPDLPEGSVQFTRSGIEIPGDPRKDLCLGAVEKMKDLIDLPPLRIHLHKVIPIGAGLGGGSSDGAMMLMLLNDLLTADLTTELPRLAATLGSDPPFFLAGGAQLATGRGENLRPVAVPLSGQWMMLVNPGMHVPTSAVYGSIRPSGRQVDLVEILSRPTNQWQKELKNDMEEYVFAAYPPVRSIKEILLRNGAIYASMSGSGSSVFGIFEQRPTELTWPAGHKQWILSLDRIT